jgi:hypothetical protein
LTQRKNKKGRNFTIQRKNGGANTDHIVAKLIKNWKLGTQAKPNKVNKCRNSEQLCNQSSKELFN